MKKRDAGSQGVTQNETRHRWSANRRSGRGRQAVGMAEKLVTVASFLWLDDADQAAALLGGYGIEALIPSRRFHSLVPHLSLAVGGVRLQVRESRLSDAMEVLREGFWAKLVWCPECGSANVARGRRCGWLAFAVFAFGGIPVRPLPRRWRCRDCGVRWAARHET